MKKLLIRWGIKYIIRPLNRLQQTSPKIYWSIVGVLSTIQVGLNTPTVSESIANLIGSPVDLTDLNTYLLIAITAMMGSKAIEVTDDPDTLQSLEDTERPI